MTHELPIEPGAVIRWHNQMENFGPSHAERDEYGNWWVAGIEYDATEVVEMLGPYPFTRLVPLSVEERTLITRELRASGSWAHGQEEQARFLALAARIAPDQSSSVSRVQAGGPA